MRSTRRQHQHGEDSSDPRTAPDRTGHTPVLLAEVLTLLDPHAGDTALDCTAGRGGHAEALAQRIGPTGTLVLFDLDPANLDHAAARIRALPAPPRVIARHAPFDLAPRTLAEHGLKANIVLADLGFASTHVDDPSRGFSFKRDGPLDMRLDPTSGQTAADLIANLDEDELAVIFREYGEERHARRAAQFVAQERRSQPITTTAHLAQILRRAVGGPPGGIDPATRCFQALRIAVNDELGHLERLLTAVRHGVTRALNLAPDNSSPAPSGGGGRVREAGGGTSAFDWLAPGARIGIISFHSLEDRPVKQAFAALADQGAGILLSRKPVTATEAESAANPRSRSAKLRTLQVAPPAPKETVGWKRRAARELRRGTVPNDQLPGIPREGPG